MLAKRMHRHRLSLRKVSGIGTIFVFFTGIALCQQPPASADHPWIDTGYTPAVAGEARHLTPELRLSTNEIYTLPQLIDLAESHNPATRTAWNAAKNQAGALGIARSDLFPTVVASVFGQTTQSGVLLFDNFVKQILGIGQAQVALSYTLFDANARLNRLGAERARLIAANLSFNDVHRQIIFRVAAYYYELLNARGQKQVAEANLANAKAVQAAAEARLQNGLATLPDVLETRSATAQAEYNLQATVGEEETASGDLATTLTAAPESRLQVQPIDSLNVPQALEGSVEEMMKRAASQRPDLLARLAEVRSAVAEVRQARAAYYPRLSFQGSYGRLRATGEQPPYPRAYAGAPVYNAQLTLAWTAFDGGRRRDNLARAQALERQAQARAEETRDQVSNEVWRSYSDAKTALRQLFAAKTLLDASDVSYKAALESYSYGVRNILDVLSAQRTLADARSADISARVRVLTQFADLAYRTADLIPRPTSSAKP